MGDFINKLEEDSPNNGDYLVFDVLSSEIGQFNTKKISFFNFSKTLSSYIVSSIQPKLDEFSNLISNFEVDLFFKIDKRGLDFNFSERITSNLNVKSNLSCYGIAHFNKDLNLNVNKIINLSANSFNTYDCTNKVYVDNLFDSIPVIDMTLYVLRSGDRMTGNLHISSNPTTDTIINKKYVDDIIIRNNKFLEISGGNRNGIMSGYLNVLYPSNNNHIASKKYVDDLILSPTEYLPISGGLLNGYLRILDPSLNEHLANKIYVDNTDLKYVKITGSKINSGFISLNYPLINSIQNLAISKQYVDDISGNLLLYLPTSGNKLISGEFIVYDNFSSENEAINKQYVDNIIPTENVKLSGDISSNLQIKRYTEKLNFVNHISTSNISLNLDLGNLFFINLSANCTGFNIDNIILDNVYYLTLNFNQRKNSAPFANVIWQINGTPILWKDDGLSIPIITPIENKVDTFTLIHKKGVWYGINAGQNR